MNAFIGWPCQHPMRPSERCSLDVYQPTSTFAEDSQIHKLAYKWTMAKLLQQRHKYGGFRALLPKGLRLFPELVSQCSILLWLSDRKSGLWQFFRDIKLGSN